MVQSIIKLALYYDFYYQLKTIYVSFFDYNRNL